MLSYSIYRNKKSIKWVTFIHGAGGSSAIWFKQVRVFSKFFNAFLKIIQKRISEIMKLNFQNFSFAFIEIFFPKLIPGTIHFVGRILSIH